MKTLWSRGAVLAAVLVLAAGAARAEEEAWETVAQKPYVVKVRPRPGTEAKEVWAEGMLNASAADVQAALEAVEAYRLWMPYVEESRIVKELPDGARLTYTRLDLPVVSSRDYVSHVVTESRLAEDGTGVYAQKWWAEPNAIPERKSTVRLKVNDGSWRVEPRGEGKCHAVYRFTVDPAGSIPGFLANIGQKDGVVDTFRAVERRAQRRAEERKKAK